MRRGAKSKHLERRQRVQMTERAAAERLKRKVKTYLACDRVYLDWNATTPLRPEAREAMAAAWDLVGNPSSVHAEGRASRRLVEDARAIIAHLSPPSPPPA